MRNITAKPTTLRAASACATLFLPPEIVTLVRERRVEKGDALEMARAAGMLAAKRTWELLPLCHQLPLTGIDIGYVLKEASIEITVSVETLSGTGVEMEALTSASLTALTLYDLLKPHAGNVMHIGEVRVLAKSGGKTDYARALSPPGRAVILGPSDAVVAGKKRATAVAEVRAGLEKAGFAVAATELMADDMAGIQSRVQHWLAQGVDVIATVGGTGLGKSDCTVQAVRPLLTRELPGFMEAARSYGGLRTPYAMLASGIAGLSGKTLVITFPGSTRGARETLAALSAGIVHAVEGLRR